MLLNSEGLNRWGHFTSSKRATDMDEPIYLNLWTAQILADDLPQGMKNQGYNQDDINIVLEGLRSVSGLETQPGVGTAIQKYKHAERGFAGGAPGKTHLELQLQFELNVKRNPVDNTNDSYTYKFLRRWSDLTYDPLTGKMNIKQNYTAKAMTFLLHDKEGKPIYQLIAYNLFPMAGIQAPQLSYDNGNIWQNFPFQLWCDTFDEAIL